MNKINLSIAASALLVGLGTAGASAMPMNNLSGIDVGAKTEQVRLVCDRFGRCWSRPNYYSYGAYGYDPYVYSGPGYYSGYGYGSRYYGGRGGWRGGGRHRR
jgi:hypothetical protein